jgi:DNA-binding response OmpR family regulator
MPSADLLRLALDSAFETVELARFNVKVTDANIGDIEPDEIWNAVVLAGDWGLKKDDSLSAAIQRLRVERFVWSPVHIFTRGELVPRMLEHYDAVYCHLLPPENVCALVRVLTSAKPVDERRRREIVTSALVELGDELSSLSRSLNPARAVEESELRQAIAEVRKELSGNTRRETHADLTSELDRISELPSVADEDLDRLEPLVQWAEADAREAIETETFRVALHRLKNVLALAKWRPEAAVSIAGRIRCRLTALRARGLCVLPQQLREQASDMCGDIDGLVQRLLSSHDIETLGAELRALTSNVHSLLRRFESPPSSAWSPENVRRIVVVEDNPVWRSSVVNLLKSIVPCEVEIEEATSLAEAERLLQVHRASLVIVDLGLPEKFDSDVVLDAGLRLLKRFTGTDGQGNRYRYRFIVLTAAENFTTAVQAAIRHGVSPWSYLQKRAATWEAELKAQVRLALRATETKLPIVEVFKRTGRIARIDGLEISLERPQWSVLCALTESKKWGRTPQRLARDLYYQHSLVPESRSSETANLDPVDRIVLQIPHYISELRNKLTEAFIQTNHKPPAENMIVFDEESEAYYLNAKAQLLDRVEEHFKVPSRPSVLIIEDEPNWGREIVEELERRGFEVHWARWTAEAWQLIKTEMPDLISLDLELPASESEWVNKESDEANAVAFLHLIRRHHLQAPIAIFTAIAWRDGIMLEMLRQGVRVDDYLSKQGAASVARLAASLSRLWRECVTHSRIMDWDPTIPIHRIEIDSDTGLLTSVEGHQIKPTGKGRDILKALSATPNVFVSRTELIEAIYGDIQEEDCDTDVDEGLKQHIKRLRKAIKDATRGTVPGDEVICGDYGVYWLGGIVQ